MRIIAHSNPTITSATRTAARRALQTGQVSRGPCAERFERDFARRFGFSQAAAVSSGTAALHLALLAAGVKRGDAVIMPTYVCPALLNAVNYVGARPVIVDVEEDGNISATAVASKAPRQTRAMIVPHMFGFPADMKALLQLGIPVIEDCAQAIGATSAGRPVGTMGRVGVYSFYATKMITTGEGGMVAANDRRLMARVRDLMVYDHKPDYRLRFNYKMDDVRAALGSAQLAGLADFIRQRRRIADFYTRELGKLAVELPCAAEGVVPVWYRYVVKVPGRAEQIIRAMKAQGVTAERPLFRPLHRYLGLKGFPVAERLMASCVSLPIYPALTLKDAARVVKIFRGLYLPRKGS